MIYLSTKLAVKKFLETALAGIRDAQKFVDGRIVAVDCKPELKLSKCAEKSHALAVGM